ncbi:MAG: tyrosine-type recombinase/integrase [Planctomycetota bacterium]|jgi:integrase
MALEKVGVYRKWLDKPPKGKHGEPVPRSQWTKKRRHHWIVRWWGSGQKRCSKVFHTRKEAKSFAVEIQNRVNTGNADKPVQITLRKFRIEHLKLMKGQVSYATLQEHKRVLELFEKFIGSSRLLSKILPRDAEAFVADRLNSKKVSNATVNKYIRNLKSIFNRAIDPRGYIAEGRNPFGKIKPRRITESPKRYVDITEYCALITAAKDLWWKTFLAVAYCSGLRRNEILHLTWKDIDFDHKTISVSIKKESEKIVAWEPKGRKNRLVPISDEALKFLADIQVNAPDGHPYVFIKPERLERIMRRKRDGQWNERTDVVNNMTSSFHRIRKKAKVDRCKIHDFRKSAITNWSRKLPIQVTRKLAGHSNIKTTLEYYLAVRPEDFRLAGEVFNEILRECESH